MTNREEASEAVDWARFAQEHGPKYAGREFVHFKGGHYRFHAFAKDSETLETMVVYEALYGEGGLWVRPAKMFFGEVTREGRTFRRFALIEETEPHA